MLPESPSEEDKVRACYERSAIYHADRIESPLLLLHGEADTVAPVHQARVITESLERRKADVKMVEFKEDEHMLDKLETMRACLEEEEFWWRKSLLRCCGQSHDHMPSKV